MREVLEGIYHWRTLHRGIGAQVDSYWLEQEGVLIDPLVPAQLGVEWFEGRARAPQAVLLTNRHHYRDSGRFAERFGCSVHCSKLGLHEFTEGERVEGFDFGAQLPGGAHACEVGAICPDETAFYLAGARALAIADGLVTGAHRGQPDLIGFVPDALMDDPAVTKQGLLDAYGRLLEELDFEHLLLAHGGPIVGDGRQRLREMIAAGGRTAFEM